MLMVKIIAATMNDDNCHYECNCLLIDRSGVLENNEK